MDSVYQLPQTCECHKLSVWPLCFVVSASWCIQDLVCLLFICLYKLNDKNRSNISVFLFLLPRRESELIMNLRETQMTPCALIPLSLTLHKHTHTHTTTHSAFFSSSTYEEEAALKCCSRNIHILTFCEYLYR